MSKIFVLSRFKVPLRMQALFISRAMIVIVGLVSTKICTTLLNPSEMGRLALIQATVGAIVLYLVSPVGNFINRYTHFWQSESLLRTVMKRYGSYLFVLAIVCAVVFGILPLSVQLSIATTTWWMVLFIFSGVFLIPLSSAFLFSQNISGLTFSYAFFSAFLPLASLCFAYFLCIGSSPTAENWLFGTVLAQSFVTAFLWLKTKHSTQPDSKKRAVEEFNFRRIWVFAGPLLVGIGAWWIQTQLYRFAFVNVQGPEALGLFAVGFGVAFAPLSAVELLVSDTVQPAWFRSLSGTSSQEQRGKAFGQCLSTSVPILFWFAGMAAIFAQPMTRILTGESYWESFQFAVFGAFVFMSQFMARMMALFFHGENNTRATAWPYLQGALLALILIASGVTFGSTLVLLSSLFVGPAFACVQLMRKFRGVVPLRKTVLLCLFAILSFAPGWIVTYWVPDLAKGHFKNPFAKDFFVLALGGGLSALLATVIWFKLKAKGLLGENTVG